MCIKVKETDKLTQAINYYINQNGFQDAFILLKNLEILEFFEIQKMSHKNFRKRVSLVLFNV